MNSEMLIKNFMEVILCATTITTAVFAEPLQATTITAAAAADTAAAATMAAAAAEADRAGGKMHRTDSGRL